MDKSSDIYAISGRVKNIIAFSDIALSPVGNILVNSYVLVLKELHDFADKLPVPYNEELKDLLIKKEGMPEYVIRLSTPKEEPMTLYEEVMKVKAQFETNQEALEFFTKEYEALGEEYGMSGDDLWFEAENSSNCTENYRKIMSLRMKIQMFKYLIGKERNKNE
jgi:hypothetical protein